MRFAVKVDDPCFGVEYEVNDLGKLSLGHEEPEAICNFQWESYIDASPCTLYTANFT